MQYFRNSHKDLPFMTAMKYMHKIFYIHYRARELIKYRYFIFYHATKTSENNIPYFGNRSNTLLSKKRKWFGMCMRYGFAIP